MRPGHQKKRPKKKRQEVLTTADIVTGKSRKGQLEPSAGVLPGREKTLVTVKKRSLKREGRSQGGDREVGVLEEKGRGSSVYRLHEDDTRI